VFDSSEAGALATLIDEPSLFPEGETVASDTMIFNWLNRVVAKQPDIILLDYGRLESIEALTKPMSVEQTIFQKINYSTLLIAAGGNQTSKSMVTTPSVYPEVLSVGPVDDEGRLREYAEWHPKLAKPDLFMSDNLAATPLAMTLTETLLGSSFAAINAVATAVLVWSLLPDLSPKDIRELLVKAAEPIPGTNALRLKMKSAIGLAQRRVVERTLQDGTASLQTLSSLTGLEGRALSTILERMKKEGRVVRLATGRLERFQLISQ